MDVNQDGGVSHAELMAAQANLQAVGQTLLDIQADGQHLAAVDTTVELDASDALHFRVHFPWPAGAHLRVGALVLARLAHGHRQYMTVLDHTGQVLTARMLDAAQAVFAWPGANARTVVAAAPSFLQFVRLGLEHILTGYDHLLFLCGLLVVGGSLQSACRMITSFTLAHSMTLALATFDLVRLPSSVVEPLIAASIVYVGLENLWCRNLQQRWLLTCVFGLVHGLGFASVLRDLGVGAAHAADVVVPLLAFNGGVELGQLGVALLVLPVMRHWQQRPLFFSRFATVSSILLTLAGAYWLFERTVLF
jgi:hypothetical protein